MGAEAVMANHAESTTLGMAPQMDMNPAMGIGTEPRSAGPGMVHRDPATAPLRRLSVDLIKTYKHINEVRFSC